MNKISDGATATVPPDVYIVDFVRSQSSCPRPKLSERKVAVAPSWQLLSDTLSPFPLYRYDPSTEKIIFKVCFYSRLTREESKSSN